jgi:glycogen phosphorylase
MARKVSRSRTNTIQNLGGKVMTAEKKDHRHLLVNQMTYNLNKDMYSATQRDKYDATALAVRAQLAKKWIRTQQLYYNVDAKRLYYLSLEFLLGRLLVNYMIDLDLLEEYREAISGLGDSLEAVADQEWDAGLGNGGLGRLAACFLDSMTTMSYPCYGYGIRYEYGIFTQRIKDGYQTESPDNWLRYGNPWEFPRPELLYPVHFGGQISCTGRGRTEWVNATEILAMAYDYPVAGYMTGNVNTLRLWAAKSTRDFDLEFFNSGDYVRAVEDKNSSENISKVLYPNDLSIAGKELRLKQQYFFVAATVADIIRRYSKFHNGLKQLYEKVAIQLNDTHPAIAIAELIRILVDEEGIEWETAQQIAKKTFGYTNHTVLPEALETWPEDLLGHLLPRHLDIIREIDRRFLVQVARRFPDDFDRRKNMGIISEGGNRMINMARLAIVSSHAVNGVSRVHTDILKNSVFSDFYMMFPEKFVNVTNGITHRRWLLEANPAMAGLITEAIGDGWIRDLGQINALEKFADDKEFKRRFTAIKKQNKERLLDVLSRSGEVSFRPEWLLDCQAKRFHEYKRQLLNVFHVITLYNRLASDQTKGPSVIPRTILFSGKSAPGYVLCKLIIKLIHNVAEVVAAHPQAREKIEVVFVPNYGVTLAQVIIPAAELSEQISTAGYEASGTGNMKFTLNGALTIGTYDGANVEIREEVGEENFFLFGLDPDEVRQIRTIYDPRRFVAENQELAQIIKQLESGFFSPEDPNLFRPILDTILGEDRYCVLADYAPYVACQERVAAAYEDQDTWARMAILNVARSGKFSSDRSVKEYAEQIWSIVPTKAPLTEEK